MENTTKSENPLTMPFWENVKFETNTLVFSEKELPLNWKNTLEIIRILEGDGVFVIAGREYNVRSGSFVIINPNSIYSGSSNIGRPLVYQSLQFNYQFLYTSTNYSLNKNYLDPLINGDVFLPTTIVKTFPIYRDFDKLFDNLSDLNRKKNQFYELKLTTILYNFIELVYENNFIYNRRETTSIDSEDLTKSVIDYVHQHYEDDFTLNFLSEAFETSKPHMCRTFKRITNQTITEYHNNYRIKVACERLSESNDSIFKVAFDVGYKNISYFHKRFKLKTELTPNEYRDIYIKG